ncbi:M23 family metallopeptidase [Prauserella oleivorans]|uniref:M23 family metallopeptidase n=1 Tax=Prauserella oleivorans TaxID=1478153 RepID=A0ABW5W7B9_9PSEU
MAEQARKDRIAREEAERQRRAREAAEEKARHRVVAPVQGTITSNYGPRWGTTHYGLDIANEIGTPIVAPMRGVVLDAGPASGFGLWVRIQHKDGTITVYGHINSYAVSVGQEVEAGEVIAEVGNTGYSTGPHLHFEVWDPSGLKVNPLAWLQERGANIG